MRKLISVCVPAYNRPDTIRQLIHSFLRQDYPHKELVISDDSSTNEVSQVVASFGKNKQIRLLKNARNVGFAENLRKAIVGARGEYLVILGDDDILLLPHCLSRYVDTFEQYPDVSYVYANQVQFSEELRVEYEINMFPRTRYYPKGISTVEQLWLSSIFIGGLGLRNNAAELKRFYPTKKILHPQVELAGHVLMNHAAVVLEEHLIGFRSRETQFIFRALTSKNIRKAGKHQNTELFEIYDRLQKHYAFVTDYSFMNKRFIGDALILYPKEKMILGNEMLRQNYASFCAVSDEAKYSLKLWCIFSLSLITPGIVIYWLRKTIFSFVALRRKETFSHYTKQLQLSVSA